MPYNISVTYLLLHFIYILSSTQCLFVSCSDYLFKLLLIGDSGVGKSCLLLRFAVSAWPFYHFLFILNIFFFFFFLALNYVVKFSTINNFNT